MKERNKGIDILRILSMYMVVILHILSRGSGLLTNLTPGSVAWNLAWFLEIACYCAVNCFILITGYLMVDRPAKISSIVTLWLQVLFYSVGIMLIFILVNRESITPMVCVKSLFPTIGQQYWYFTAYFAMFLLLPFINLLLRQLDKKHYTILIAVLVGLFSVLNTCSLDDCFKIENGYSVVWLLTVYAIGGYIKRFHIFEQKPFRLLVGYLLAVSLTWMIKAFSITIPFVGWQDTIINSAMAVMSSALIAYSSPTILLAAVCLFGVFKQIKGQPSKLLLQISSMSFAVYLIHTHPLIFNNVFTDAFAFICKLPWMVQAVVVLLVAAGVFAICLGIETMRSCLFRLCQIKNVVGLIDQKLGKYGVFSIYGYCIKDKNETK